MIETSNRIPALFALAALAALLSGCVTPGETTKSSDVPEASLCDIAARPEAYLGKTVRMQVGYTVVRNHDSYFSGRKCSSESEIMEGPGRNADRTVSKFVKEGDRLCKARGVTSLCRLEADLTVDVRIQRDSTGQVVADPLHVEAFRYLPVQEKIR